MSRWWKFLVVVVLCWSSAALAQVSTPTVTATPTMTPLTAGARPGGSTYISNQVLFDSSTPATGTYLYTLPYTLLTVTVAAIGTCSAFSLVIESANSQWPAAWANNGAALTTTDVPANTGKTFQLIAPVMFTRARLASATSCRLVVTLAGFAP